MVIYDWLGSIYGLRICRKGKGMLEVQWVWAKRSDLWARRVKLQAKIWQSDKNNRNFRGVGVCLWGWCDYPFIMELRRVISKNNPKCPYQNLTTNGWPSFGAILLRWATWHMGEYFGNLALNVEISKAMFNQ